MFKISFTTSFMKIILWMSFASVKQLETLINIILKETANWYLNFNN